MHQLGQTRSAWKPDHLLQTPDTFVRTPLPGLSRGVAIVHCGPALDAGFTQYTAELESDGVLSPVDSQRFVYVIEGTASVLMKGKQQELTTGSFAYIATGDEQSITAKSETRLAVIEKTYKPLPGAAAANGFVGDEASIVSQALAGDEALQVRSLLPADPAFDFAVNTMMYEPGASLSMVEVHVMEHGLLMLEGGGIYRLGDCWYPVMAGDFIWMRAFCPQWYGALGKVATKYLIYKDWNRRPSL